MTEIPGSAHDGSDDAGPPRGRLPRERRPEVPPSSWRLTFEYDGSGVRLVAQQRVAMLAPPDDSDLTYAARAGHWIEVSDATGHGLYRQILHDPMRSRYEVHSADVDAVPASVAVPSGSTGVFQVVVPDLPGGTEIVLHSLIGQSSQATAGEPGATAAAVLRAELSETSPYEEG
jgi:hypothetical protein